MRRFLPVVTESYNRNERTQAAPNADLCSSAQSVAGAAQTALFQSQRVLAVALLVAVLVTSWALRGAISDEITFNDEARHAMNGAALFDLFRNGAMGSPVAYLHNYFARLPALSLPYHPPLFPAVEALFYALLGVSPFAARLAVASFVFGSVIILISLISRTHSSGTLAASVALTFFSLPTSQNLAADVMLEMPALFFILASVWFMAGVERQWSLTSALCSAVLAVAGVWTKQTIYLGLIPPLVLLLAGCWRLWRFSALWAFGLTFALGTLSFWSLSAAAGLTGFSKGWAEVSLVERLVRNSFFYMGVMWKEFGWGLLMIPATVFVCWLASRRVPFDFRSSFQPLYIAWLCAVVGVVVAVPAFDSRYMLFAWLPALVVIFHLFYCAIGQLVHSRAAHVAVIAVAVFVALGNARVRRPSLKGPALAAEYVYASGGRRVLFAGGTNGSYIFATRVADTTRSSVVLRGDKLPKEVFQPKEFDSFAHRYGIEYIILEQRRTPQPWDALSQNPLQSMRLQRSVPVMSSEPTFEGTLHIYQYLNPSADPVDVFEYPVMSTGQALQLDVSKVR